MSKSINVNPDHYKVAGRERPTTVARNARKPSAKPDAQARARWERKQRRASVSPSAASARKA